MRFESIVKLSDIRELIQLFILRTILYFFQPFPLFLKDIVLIAISLSHMGTTPVLLTVAVFLLSGFPPLTDGGQEPLPYEGIGDRIF